ncbi:MAG: coagulation factor 5/8 type domain protein [Fibrobacteres bacterium]|nr:coagulation factor 5/8 type domain protein [Fibrobacterota bacterium]
MRIETTVYEVLKMLRPYDIDIGKARIGSLYDGGYILAANTTPDQVVLSYGLGGEISFDTEMAAKGHPCYMFDHTIGGLPASHPNFHFHPEGVAGATDAANSLFTVEDHLDRFSISGDRLILKMDVEGAEWEAIRLMPDQVLSRFEQIAIEVHHFGRMRDPAFLGKVAATLEKVNRHFTLFHVHANNNNTMEVVSGYPIYNLLELSYIKTDVVKRMPSRTLYPTELDYPNEQDRDDYVLSVFPFRPEGLGEAEHDAHARRFKIRNDAIIQATLLYKDALKHLEGSRLDEAEACLRDCLRGQPGRHEALLALVNVLNRKAIELYNAGRLSDAAAALREALGIMPGNPELGRNLEVVVAAQAASPAR